MATSKFDLEAGYMKFVVQALIIRAWLNLLKKLMLHDIFHP